MANLTTKIRFPAYIVQKWISLMRDPTKNDTVLRMEGVQIKMASDAQMAKADRDTKPGT